MKRVLLLLAAAAFVACGRTQPNKTADPASPQNGVEVLSFHTRQRCPTCVAIEQLTREVVETDFAAQLSDRTLVFRVVDISEDEALADKYEVTWSSLLVNRHENGAESVNDLTKFAFANARTNPDKFRAELKAAIGEMLKETGPKATSL